MFFSPHFRNYLSYTASILLLLILLVFGVGTGVAHASEASDMRRLNEIQTLSDSDNEEGLKQLLIFQTNLLAATQSAGGAPSSSSTLAPPLSLTPTATPTTNISDSVQIRVLDMLANLYLDAGDMKKFASTTAQFLQYGRDSKSAKAAALAQIHQIGIMIDDSKLDAALDKLRQIHYLAASVRDVEVDLRLTMMLGAAYNTKGLYEQALTYYLEGMRLSEQQPRRAVHAKLNTLSIMAGLYWRMKDYDKSLATAKQALALASTVNAPKLLADIYNMQAVVLGQVKRDDESVAAYQQALKIGIEGKMPKVQANALICLSDHYLKVSDYKNAELFSYRGLHIAEAIGNNQYVAIAKVNLGLALGGQGKVAQGAAYVNDVVEYFTKSDSKWYAETTIGELADMYERAGMFREALTTLRKQQKLSDELYRAQRTLAVATLQEKFNAEQREKQIELLAKGNSLKDADIKNRQLQQIITMLGGLATVMVGAVVFLLYRRARRVNLDLQQVNNELEFDAEHDPLTGLHNRRAFVELMNERSARATKERRRGGPEDGNCLILLDIDHFKKINDSCGHAVGDSVLKEVARRLTATVREADMVLRWGGEEFLIFSPKSSVAQITRVVDRILWAIGDTDVVVGDMRVPVTCTAGFIALPFSGLSLDDCSWETALQFADVAMYLGKQNGRNRGCGLSHLLVRYEVALPLLSSDLAAAERAGMVDLIKVKGPERRMPGG